MKTQTSKTHQTNQSIFALTHNYENTDVIKIDRCSQDEDGEMEKKQRREYSTLNTHTGEEQ